MPQAPSVPVNDRMSRGRMLWSGLFILILALLYFAVRIVFPAPAVRMSTLATVQEPSIPNAPAPTAADRVAVQEDFQYLVSYTEKGFSPGALRMKKGETVRFTNNSSTPLKITLASGAPLSLERGAYIQYTADTTGNIPYSDGIISGALIVTQ